MNLHTESSEANPTLRTLCDSGRGRTVLLLVEQQGEHRKLVESIVSALAQRGRVVALEYSSIKGSQWRENCDHTIKRLGELSVRQFSIVGLGSAATIAQELALRQLRQVRTLVLVDATTRPHPSLSSRIIDRLERSLPLGLPLRRNSVEFDGRPLLHRLRCPALVISTTLASQLSRAQSAILLSGLPTAFSATIAATDFEQLSIQVAEAAEGFQETPAKCPQRQR